MNGETDNGLNPIAKLAEFQQEQLAIKEANATPLPGPLRNAFAIAPEIIVGTYKVRPIVDRDLEFLQLLEHPLYFQFKGKEVDLSEMVRGSRAWELCFMFTHDFKEIKKILKEDGPQSFKDRAADEFEQFQLPGLIELVKAVYKQLEAYWEPVIAYKTPDESDSKKNILAVGTEPPKTDLGLPLRSVAS